MPELREAMMETMRVADTDLDGKITREEAIGALNFVLGGFFLRADANADGKITEAERQAMTSHFGDEYPMVMTMLRGFGQSPAAKKLVEVLDVDTAGAFTLAEARAAAKATVNELFAVIDADANDTITLAEAEVGVTKASAALAKTAFDRWDADSSGGLTQAEFVSGFAEPLRRVFALADTDGDKELTASEANAVLSWLGARLQNWVEPAEQRLSSAVTVSN